MVVPSLGAKRYLSALRYAELMLGNSSSGIMEGPASHIPTVNVGDRQKGRVMAESVLSCQPVRADIAAAMRRALSPEFKQVARNAINPFGDGRTSEKISSRIYDFLCSSKQSTKKAFFDIPIEVEQ